MTEIIQEFTEVVSHCIADEIPSALEAAILSSADSFAEWGQSAATGKCEPADDTIFHTISKVAFAGDPEVAKAAEMFYQKCYTHGYTHPSLP